MARSLAFAVAGIATGALLLGALPARADSNFEVGFERELGRIVAHEAVSLGRHILIGVFQPYHRPYQRPYPYRVHRRHGYHHRHHRAPCGYETYERYESYHGGPGHYESYERGVGPPSRIRYR